jgi:phosphate:Na+ symporter
MLYLEEQIKASAGRAFKQIVKNATNTHFKSLLTGIFSTILFQSSSVITLMALSLVGAELINLESSIAIIQTALYINVIGAIGGTPNKKRVALVHLIFNLSTGVVTLLFLHQLIYLFESFIFDLTNKLIL